jgi:antitoxin (DNA-binding transcriptional repressor) of toxin-antitoxin stability system
MIHLNIHEAKTHLSKYLQDLTEDEPILLCKRNIPVAKIVGLNKKPLKKRVIGLAKGEFVVPDDINNPLPDEVLDSFEGR